MLCPICLMRLGLEDEETPEPDRRRGSVPAQDGPRIVRGDSTEQGHAGETIICVGESPSGDQDVAEPVSPSSTLLLLGEIARGGVGVVLLARDTALGRDLAVKVLKENHRDRPEMVRRFVDEARIAGQLQHPGVVPVHGLGVLADGRPYFTMKLVKGPTLAESLAERRNPIHDLPHLLAIFLQVAHTIAYAHARGVIHLDLKPSNIMLGKYGEVRVMDWGLARVLTRRADGTSGGKLVDLGARADASESEAKPNGRFMGTPGYMAPEQFLADPDRLDERTDVFALGAILCETLTGRPIYDGGTLDLVRHQAAHADLARALEALQTCGVDEGLIALARDCLAPDRDARPRDAGTVAARLTAHLEGVQERLRAAELARVDAQARASEARKRQRLTALLAALVLTLAALGVNSYASWLQRRQTREKTAAVVLREVEVLGDEAAADPAGDPARWSAAQAVLRRAGLLLADASPETRRQLSALEAQVQRGLRRAGANRRLLDHLEVARYGADEGDLKAADAQFEAAFREAGLDVADDSAAVGRDLVKQPRDVKDMIIAALDCWAIVRRERAAKGHKHVAPWQRPLAAARAADPDPWRNGLRAALESEDHQALSQLARTDDIESRPAPSLWLMGRLLMWSGQTQQATSFLTRAWRMYPQDFWINLDLSLALMLDPWQPDVALIYATSAVALRPESAVAHLRLGWIHQVFANKVDAEAEYRTALRLWPDYGRAHARLAGLLFFRSRRDEAALEYRLAIKLMPDEAEPLWVGLGDSLMRLHRLEDAAVELEEAARRYPLSCAVWLQAGRLRLALRDVLKASESLAHAATLAKPGSPQATQVAQEQERVKLLARMPALLRGQDHFGDNTERLELAKLCGEAGLAAAGARLYAEAIAVDASTAEDRVIRARCYGAFLAAWAGSGSTRDDPAPTNDERARLRRQARAWLRDELTTWTPWLQGGRSGNRRDAAAALRGWQNTHELAGVRDPDALAKLPQEESEAWRSLWQEVASWLPVDPG